MIMDSVSGKKTRAELRRNWGALLRSPANSRSSVAADNHPRNATQVIVGQALGRAKLIALLLRNVSDV